MFLTGVSIRDSMNATALVAVQVACGIGVYSATTWKYNLRWRLLIC
jgi:hypothetical protein